MFSYSISYNFSFVYLFEYVLYSINLNRINAILTKKHSYKKQVFILAWCQPVGVEDQTDVD